MKLASVCLYYTAWNIFTFVVVATNNTCDSVKNSTTNDALLAIFNLLDTAGLLLNDVKKYACIAQSSAISRDSLLNKPTDCAEIKTKNETAKSSVYTIWPLNRISKGSVQVFCDMEDDGGGWTVIQRRGDFDSEKDYFYQDWEAYKNGFGDQSKDFWLGNDNIFALTNQRASVIKFTLSDWEGNTTYATYDRFWIDDEPHKYTAHVKGYRGTAGNSFSFVNGVPFSTKDRDNDQHEKSCAEMFKGAWWYTSCHGSNLNGWYLKGAHKSYADGVEWSSFRGQYYSLKDTVMKIRPMDYNRKDKFEIPVTPQ
ncbi:techylectin-5A-like isoform X1 [Stegodyphus dumicola]|uniref:techylectin-5A-like isoform X1 n=2 Tax=Stegodyphus dumicola TaxID=202533 RepID=UPI0015AD4BE0|nr:techylectin-5A-like isoform X1 [Stegodyphus dumicola]